MTYKVLIVDDAEINLILFEALLKRMGNCEVVKFSNSCAGLACAKSVDFDLVIVDYMMPDLNGLEAAREIRQRFPEINIIMVTMDLSEDLILQCVAAGIKGYIPKDSPETELVEAIHKVLNGNFHLNENTLALAQKQSKIRKQVSNSNLSIFSAREIEILKLVIEGKTSATIATELNISRRTVEHHRSNMMEKSGTKTQAALLRFALRGRPDV